MATEYTRAPEAEIETNAGQQELPEIPQAGTRKRVRKQRLVSYSSQESASSQDETTSRHSGRKRTAVTKMGAVMIDNIQQVDKRGSNRGGKSMEQHSKTNHSKVQGEGMP